MATIYILVDERTTGRVVICPQCRTIYELIDDREPGFSSIETAYCLDKHCGAPVGSYHNDMGCGSMRVLTKARVVSQEEYEASDMAEL